MKVLVVDDDPVGLAVLRAAVLAQGHEVLCAADGERAWDLLVEHEPAVLITDREMPALDGIALCRRVRARDDARYTYVVLLTGHDTESEALEGMQAGADDYLVKPLRTEDLRLRLVAAQRVTDLHERLARQRQQLDEIGAEQHGLARRDPLTGLGNRRALLEELERLDARFRRYGHGYALALLDVDHFKLYNDTAGHLAGDDVLRFASAAMAAQLRDLDGLYRYGGEEFVCLLVGDGLDARVAVERLRRAVLALEMPHPALPGQVVTVTAGVAVRADRHLSGELMLAEADDALYRGKRAGRDRVVLAERGGPQPDVGLPEPRAAGGPSPEQEPGTPRVAARSTG